MIVPMKKIALLVLDKDRENSLLKIRDLGLLHLVNKTASSQALSKLMTRRSQIETATGIVEAFAPKKGTKLEKPEFKGDLVEHIITLSERRKRLTDKMFSHNREMLRFSKWGDFNPRDFEYLAEHGVNACLYELPLDTYQQIVGDVPVVAIDRDKASNEIRLFAYNEIPGRQPYPMQDKPLHVYQMRRLLEQKEMDEIEIKLASFSLIKKELETARKAVLEDIEFEIANAGMDHFKDESGGSGKTDFSVSWITGYVPAPDMGKVKRAASENNWALCADDPADDDMEVPTKLKNNSFSQLIYPLTGFLELIPGYRETDVSGWFLVFFTLFFGMIFGDAAYGVILFLVAIIGIMKTAKKGVPLGFKFLLLMSVSNIIWGVLVCSWFGLDTAALPRILQDISLPLIVRTSAEPGWLAAYNASNYWVQYGVIGSQATLEGMNGMVKESMLLFCFSIALVQLSIAHLKTCLACLRSPKLFAKVFGEIGRLAMILGMYFVILSLIVYNTGFGGVKAWQYYCLFGGFGLVFIFGSYEGSVLTAIKTSCSNIITVILSITNVFSDLMSYIRLWAVGLAGSSIAGMINSLAVPIILKNAAFIAVGLVFFAFGHVFNMVLNVLAVLVHGVRLNMLEFSSHVGVAWSGFAYKPFAKRYNITTN